MRTQKIKFITALFLGLTGLSSINASNPLADEAAQQDALVRKIVAFEQPNFLMKYFGIVHDCDFPLLESLKHVLTPTLEETTAFLKLVKNTPGFTAQGLSDDMNHAIRVLAEEAFDDQGQLKNMIFFYNPTLGFFPRLLGALTNLNSLFLERNKLSDINSLGTLTRLQTLSLCDNQISDIRSLGALTNLRLLDLSLNQPSDINSLGALTNLNKLILSQNQISDISSLGALTNLQKLSLSGNQISDINSLGALTNLNALFLEDNQLSDISSLGTLTNLQELFLNNNQISVIRSLGALTNLRLLTIHTNPAVDTPEKQGNALKQFPTIKNISVVEDVWIER